MAGFERAKRRSPRGSRRTPTLQKRKLDMADSRTNGWTSVETSNEVSQLPARSFYNKSSSNQKQPYIGPLERKFLREIEEKRAQRSRESSAERSNGETQGSPPTVPAGPRKYIITVPVKKTRKATPRTPVRKSPRKAAGQTLTPIRQSPTKAKTSQVEKTSPGTGKGATGSALPPQTPPRSVDSVAETVYTLAETPSLFSDIDSHDADDSESFASSGTLDSCVILGPTPPDDFTTAESQHKSLQMLQGPKASRVFSSPKKLTPTKQTSPKSSPYSSIILGPTPPEDEESPHKSPPMPQGPKASRGFGSPKKPTPTKQMSPKSSPSQRQTKQVTLHAFLRRSPPGKNPGKETHQSTEEVEPSSSEETLKTELFSEVPRSSEQEELLMAFEELANAAEQNQEEENEDKEDEDAGDNQNEYDGDNKDEEAASRVWDEGDVDNTPSVCGSEDLFPGYKTGGKAEDLGTPRSTSGKEVDWRVGADGSATGDEVSPSKSSTDSGCGSEVMEDQSGEPAAKRPRKCWPIFSSSPSPRSRSRVFNKSSPRSSPLSTGKLKLPRKTKETQGMEQLIIDAGQRKIGAIVCETCGMLYTVGHAEDETAHQKYHHKFLISVRFEGWKKEHVLATFHDGRIIMVLPDDPKYAIKKAEEVRELVDNELGFIKGYSTTRSNCKTLLFISNDKRVVGCVIAEGISQAYRVLPVDSPPSQPSPTPLRAWCCDTRPVRAVCGISRVWTFRLWRKRKVASRMVDTLRAHYAFGCILSKEDVAFSDPTPDGRKFAESYCGTSAFLCYK